MRAERMAARRLSSRAPISTTSLLPGLYVALEVEGETRVSQLTRAELTAIDAATRGIEPPADRERLNRRELREQGDQLALATRAADDVALAG